MNEASRSTMSKYGNIIVEAERVRDALCLSDVKTTTLYIALPASWRDEFRSMCFPQGYMPSNYINSGEIQSAALHGFHIVFDEINMPEIRYQIILP